MRKIKTRIFDKETGAYHLPSREGSLFAVSLDGVVCSGYINGSMSTGVIDEEGNQRWVAESFSGLIDSDGRDIYEGDVLTWSAPKDKLHPVRQGVVTFKDGTFYVGQGNLSMIAWRSQILGNINQNPDLGV